MDMRIPPLKNNIMLESNPPKSTMFVGRLGVPARNPTPRNLARNSEDLTNERPNSPVKGGFTLPFFVCYSYLWSVYIFVCHTIINSFICCGEGSPYGRFPKFHRVFLGRDPGTLKSDIMSKKHPQLICSDLRLSDWKFEDWHYGNRP